MQSESRKREKQANERKMKAQSHTGRAETGNGKGNEREQQANERKMKAQSHTGRLETGRGKEK